MEEQLQVPLLPYRNRQIVCVAADKAVKYLRAIARQKGTGWETMEKVASLLPLVHYSARIGPVTHWLMGTEEAGWIERAQDRGVAIFPITHAEAEQLRFPIGHPRDRVLYVGHPVVENVYVPMADFHRFIFEHKVAEALRLITSLGAVEAEVEHVTGWRQATVGAAGASLPFTDIGLKGELGRTVGLGRHLLSRMTLVPSRDAHIPDGLVWYQHEPLWMELAHARLESGLTSFQVDVRYTEDFGVNAALGAAVLKTKFDIGGNFTKHESTVWRLHGRFA